MVTRGCAESNLKYYNEYHYEKKRVRVFNVLKNFLFSKLIKFYFKTCCMHIRMIFSCSGIVYRTVKWNVKSFNFNISLAFKLSCLFVSVMDDRFLRIKFLKWKAKQGKFFLNCDDDGVYPDAFLPRWNLNLTHIQICPS